MSNALSRRCGSTSIDQTAVEIDSVGRPSCLLDLGHHFCDAPPDRRSRPIVTGDEIPEATTVEDVNKQQSSTVNNEIESTDCIFPNCKV